MTPKTLSDLRARLPRLFIDPDGGFFFGRFNRSGELVGETIISEVHAAILEDGFTFASQKGLYEGKRHLITIMPDTPHELTLASTFDLNEFLARSQDRYRVQLQMTVVRSAQPVVFSPNYCGDRDKVSLNVVVLQSPQVMQRVEQLMPEINGNFWAGVSCAVIARLARAERAEANLKAAARREAAQRAEERAMRRLTRRALDGDVQRRLALALGQATTPVELFEALPLFESEKAKMLHLIVIGVDPFNDTTGAARAFQHRLSVRFSRAIVKFIGQRVRDFGTIAALERMANEYLCQREAKKFAWLTKEQPAAAATEVSHV